MSQFKATEICNPFWAENEGFKGGRDPMGIENSSIATYGRLLPGLTNLTGHIRYYSLYCWLLSVYDELEIGDQTKIHQYNFIRRAELALAFIMNGTGVGAVIGSLFITNNKLTIAKNGKYNLGQGADFQNSDKYWSFNSGGFGQYYAGSLIGFKLIKLEEKRFYLLSKGKELAQSFKSSVDDDVLNLFVSCIKSGYMSTDEAKKLLPLGLNRIELHSKEWTMLNDLLTKSDDDNSYRKDTVYLTLKDIQNGVNVANNYAFIENRFVRYNDDCGIDAAFGWYFFYLSESFHFSVESILCLILNSIKSYYDDHKYYPQVGLFIDETVQEILNNLDGIDSYGTVEEWMRHCNNDITESFAELIRLVNSEKNYPLAAAKSFEMLLRLQNEVAMNKEKIQRFESSNHLTDQNGILSKGLRSYTEKHNHLNPRKYVSEIVKQVMNEHTYNAIRKMGNSSVDLRKFVIEDERIFLVEIRYPNLTSPRIRSLLNFLVDLKYIGDDNKLTEVANNYMDSYEEK